MKKNSLLTCTVTAALLAVTTIAGATDLEMLQKQVEELNDKVKVLQKEKTAAAAPSEEGYAKKLWNGTRFGGYGELDAIFRRENGNGKGGNVFDPHRFVLYVNSNLADWITLNTELEWEHAGASDKVKNNELSGEVMVEQAFLDFKLARAFNVKAGIMLVPLGATNLYHEPTNFNSTERPELDRFLIPSTWREMGVGIHGALGNRVDYQLMVMNGLDGTQFSGKNGIRDGRQNMNKDINRNKAVTGRVEIRPMTNLYTNLSFYTANSAPSGKPTSYTTVAAFDAKYNIGNFDVAGEYVHVYQDNPALLNDTIGNNMSGYWVEGAYHVMPQGWKKGKLIEADAVLFLRYSEFDTQVGGAINPAKTSGLYDRSYTTFGISFKPVTQLAIKADYQIYGDHGPGGSTRLDNDKFQLTLGFVF
ncbi:MAG: porin [Geobacter sp.]|nr:MAG: porin [Geobacter sp.]